MANFYHCCGSGMLIPDADFCPSRIPEPTTAPKEEGGKIFFCPTIFCSHKYHKIVKQFYFWTGKKISFSQNNRNYSTSDPKICHKLSKIWGLESRIWKKPVPDPGSKRHRIPDPHPNNTVSEISSLLSSMTFSLPWSNKLYNLQWSSREMDYPVYVEYPDPRRQSRSCGSALI